VHARLGCLSANELGYDLKRQIRPARRVRMRCAAERGRGVTCIHAQQELTMNTRIARSFPWSTYAARVDVCDPARRVEVLYVT
jgi:hypothetical protein